MNILDNYLLFTWLAFGCIILFLWIRSCLYCHHLFHERAMSPLRRGAGGQEINTVSRHAELRSPINELPPDYNKCGGLPPAYELVVAGNPPPYTEAIQLQMNATLASAARPTVAPRDHTAADLSGVVVIPAAPSPRQTQTHQL